MKEHEEFCWQWSWWTSTCEMQNTRVMIEVIVPQVQSCHGMDSNQGSFI